ncbi:Uncharacterised protein [Mycobacteroides abscessus subsp. abscessus]|nr:Uncharacterised protein [Mycobacteroides abscessus subsp. abscessus]
MTSETTRPAIMVSAKISTHSWAGSRDTCRFTKFTAPSNRTIVPSFSFTDCPGSRLARATWFRRFCSIMRGSRSKIDCALPESSPVSPR